MTIEHKMGQYYLMDAASMVPVSLFDMEIDSPLILDMAASPGGKTTHLIDRSGDKGFILANDGSKGRISALRSVLSNWGGANFTITNYPGESFGAWFPETFDRVLLDAPCSMENLRPTENRPLRETTQDERLRLQERQTQLLLSGLASLKVGGQLVYATCSLAPEEDEAVVNAVLEQFPHALQIEDVSQRFTFHTPGITSFNDQQFDPSLKHALHLWPHLTGMSGFFTVLITKVKSFAGERETPPARDFNRTGLVDLPTVETQQLTQELDQAFGFPLPAVLDEYHLRLMQRNQQTFLIPEAYLTHFQELPYEYIGMPLGKWANERFEPSAECISRFGHHFTTGQVTIADEQVQQWVSGRDIRYPQMENTPRGQYVLVRDPAGRNLGLGKLLPKRLRNMLPR
jgi:16S rRNA (cytosine1407-C5)-methyltransferase